MAAAQENEKDATVEKTEAAAPAADAKAADGDASADSKSVAGAAGAAGAPGVNKARSGSDGAGAAAMAPAFNSASLYVGDLASDVSEGILFEIFSKHGQVASIRVCRDAVTRRSLCYAYVNFHAVADAERALAALNFTEVRGKTCRVMRSQRDPSARKTGVGNLFIKNLDTSVDHRKLFEIFSAVGTILSCKVSQDEKGGSKGFGYVHCASQEVADEAIAKLNGTKIGELEVSVEHFVRREQRPDQAEWTNCYVKNLPAAWDDAKLETEFAKFGKITSAKISLNEAGESRGFGWVSYEEHACAAAAVEGLNGATSFYTEEEKKAAAGEGAEGAEKPEPLFVGRMQKKAEREREQRRVFEAQKQERINKYQGVNLFVKNIDDQVLDDQLREKFAPFGTITSARVMRDGGPQGVSRGFGFVCFSTPEEAAKAVSELNGALFCGKPLFVALHQRKEVRQAQLESQHAPAMPPPPQALHHGAMMGGMRGPGGGMGGHPGMMPQGMAGYGMIPGTHPGTHGHQQMQMLHQQQQQAGMGAPRGYPMMAAGGMGMAPQMGAMQGMGGQPQYAPDGSGRGQRMPRGAMAGQHQQMGGQPRQPRSDRGQGGYQQPGQQGMPGQQQPRGQKKQQQQQGQQYQTQQMRGPMAQMPPPPPQQQQQQMPPQTAQQQNDEAAAAAAAASASQPLTLSGLANATPAQQRNMLGERLYPLIHASQPQLAGRITGMLLEMDNGELLNLLESPEALRAKIAEALEVLKAHNMIQS